MIRFSHILTLTLAYCLQAPAQDTLRQRAYYPESVPMDDETVEWRKDIYKEIILTEEANSGLFSPSDQEDEFTGLFANIFDMVIQGKIKLYKYEIDSNEKLTRRNEISIKNILDDYHITYTADSTGLISINRSDVPYADITSFYVKEAVYYDAVNSSFRSKVIALCPVMVLEDEFSDQPVRYPLFWVRYAELQPRLENIIFYPEARNHALRMTMDDFFTLNRYKGEIYKVYNDQATTLAQTCQNDSSLTAEREKIAGGIKELQKRAYNVYHGRQAQKVVEEIQPETVIRYRWVFPWQKKKTLEARKESENDNTNTAGDNDNNENDIKE